MVVAVMIVASASGEGSSGGEAPRWEWWIGDQWTVRAEAIERGPGWLRFDRARMTRGAMLDEQAARDDWVVRANRLYVRVRAAAPRRIAALWASGAVRVVGPEPIYVSGDQLWSFRPGTVMSVRGSEQRAQLDGDGWTLRGSTIRVDLQEGRASVEGLAGQVPPHTAAIRDDTQ